MEKWKATALLKSIQFIFSASSMIITIGSELSVIFDCLIFGGSITPTSYAIYLTMFLEIFIQSFFYLSAEYDRRKLHKLLIIALIYILILIAGAFYSTTLWNNRIFIMINRAFCTLVASAVAISDVSIISEIFLKYKPKEVFSKSIKCNPDDFN